MANGGQEDPSAAASKGEETRAVPRQHRRRGIGNVVTEDRIQKIADSLDRLFVPLSYSVPPSDDHAERERRRMALRGGAQRALLGALVYLNEHNPAVARALLLAGRDWAEQVLRGKEPRFLVKLSAKKRAPVWMMYPAMIGVHRRIVSELKDVWSATADAGPLLGERFVGHTGRFGAAQLTGTRRHHARVRQRVAAVIETYNSTAAESGIDAPGISEATARRWVTQDKTPAAVSRRILGTLLGKSPRVIKEMLNEAGRYMRKADEQHRILDLWDFGRSGSGSVKSDDRGLPSQGGGARKR